VMHSGLLGINVGIAVGLGVGVRVQPLKFRDLSEPTQGALYFFLFYLMSAGEALKTHVLESGSLQ